MKINSLVAAVSALCFGLLACDDEQSGTPLPSGCSRTGDYAVQVIQSNPACRSTNAFTDAELVLGPRDAGATGEGKTEYRGFMSLGINGSVVVYMGACVQDLPGPDLRVYQSVSREAVEVQVASTVDGPFLSLGAKDCEDPPPYFSGFCEFDLAGSGLNNIRVVKVIDRELLTFPGAACDNAGLSPGADIDAIQVIHPG